MNDTNYQVTESGDKIALKAQVKRGSATRDQDKIDVKVKGSDAAETASRLGDVLTELEANGIAGNLRSTQPSDTGE